MRNRWGKELPAGAEQVYAGIRALSAHDADHAREDNGVGFNGRDTQWGNSIAQSPLEDWSPKMVFLAHRMLRIYQGQLKRYGIDWAAIPPPPNPAVAPVASTGATPAARPGTPIGSVRVSMAGLIDIRFPYDADLVAAVKALPGRRYNGEGKYWTVPQSATAVPALQAFVTKYRFTVDPTAQAVFARFQAAPTIAVEPEPSAADMDAELAAMIAASRAEDADLEGVMTRLGFPLSRLNGLGGTLRPFQRAGVAYLLSVRPTRTGKRSSFLADDMGTGKTIAALVALELANAYPAIVAVPAVVKLNWEREAKKWLPHRTVRVLWGDEVNGHRADITIVNYDILHKYTTDLTRLGQQPFQCVIADEAHYTKSAKARRSVALEALCNLPSVTWIWMLTGTPVPNRPAEFINALKLMGRLKEFGGWMSFATRYCGATRGRFGWEMSGAQNLEELNAKLRASCFIRRRKADIMKELPPKERSLVTLDLDNRPHYNEVEADVIAYIRESAKQDRTFRASIGHLDPDAQRAALSAFANSAAEKARRAEHLVRIEKLKQVAVEGKLAAIKTWVGDFLETGEKLVLFAHHVSVVKRLAQEFAAPLITGETSLPERQRIIDRFQGEAACRLVVCNIKAGGIGITLTAASNVAFVELAWTPADHDQAEDRCHRIGQDDTVTAWYLLARDTIDDDIYELVQEKRAVVEAATDGTALTETRILNDLMDRLAARGAR